MSNKIYFKQIIYKIWKEKILIFLISIAFSLLAYFFSLSSLSNKIYSEIVLNNPPFDLFDDYTHNITGDNDYFNQLLTLKIHRNFLNITNLEKFVDQSTEFNSFKIYLKSRNISVKEYFRKNKIGLKKDVNNNFLIFINHTNDLEGILFLQSYIKYSKDISVVQIKKIFKNLISNRLKANSEILIFQREKSANEELDITIKIKDSDKKITPIFEQFRLNKLNQRLDVESFDYNLYDFTVSDQKIIDKDKKSIAYSLLGLIFGLFLSLAFIFLRN